MIHTKPLRLKKDLYIYFLILTSIFSFNSTTTGQVCKYNPIYSDLNKLDALAKDYKSLFSNRNSSSPHETVVTIPVVFHVIFPPLIDYPVSQNDLLILLGRVNEDFRKLNSDVDIIKWPQAADSKIQFCLASVDPKGQPTDGFTITESQVPCWDHPDLINKIKKSAHGGHDPWDPTSYINIWISNLNCNGLLGITAFITEPIEYQGIIIDESVLLNCLENAPPYEKGRTLVHELGHYFNLCHIWSCTFEENDNCTYSDQISDTPPVDGPHENCIPYSPSCPGIPNEMWENFMDYTHDACKNLFTQDQVIRMRSTLLPQTNQNLPSRESLLYSSGCNLEPQCLLKYKIVFDFSNEISFSPNPNLPPHFSPFNPFHYSVKYSSNNEEIISGDILSYPSDSTSITFDFCALDCIEIEINSEYDFVFGTIKVFSPFGDLIGIGNISDYIADFCEVEDEITQCPQFQNCQPTLSFADQNSFYLINNPINTDNKFYISDANYLSLSNKIGLAYRLSSPIIGSQLGSLSFDLRSYKLPDDIKIGLSNDLYIDQGETYFIGGSNSSNNNQYNLSDQGYWRHYCLNISTNPIFNNQFINYIFFIVDDISIINFGWAEFKNVEICLDRIIPPITSDNINLKHAYNVEENSGNFLVYNYMGQFIKKVDSLEELKYIETNSLLIVYSIKEGRSQIIAPTFKY